MEKQQEAQPDSLSTVTVKEYPPSEVYSSEPPPAYQKPRSTAVQIARIAAVTVVLVSFVLGAFILAAAWIEASASCHQLAQLQALAVAQDEAAAVGSHDEQPVFQRLVDNKAENSIGNEDENKPDDKEVSHQQPQSQTQQPETEQTVSQDHTPIQIRLPLQLDFDDLAGAMMEKNQRSRMNCVVEKRRAEEIVDHQPHTIRLPFGVNLTTDPRYEHISGEKMAIYCESGKDQRHMPMEMMATPIVVPLPGPVHLPLQFHGPMQQPHQNRIPIPVNRAAQPAVGLVPPPPNHVQQVPVPVAVPMHNMQLHPSQVHAAIQVTETREDQLPSQPQFHSQAETEEGRVMHRIPVQFEAREGRTLQQVPVQMTTRDGRAFSHVPLPIHVETHKVRAFTHPPVPIQVETHEGQTFHPVQVEGHESRAFQHQQIPVHAYMGESQAFNPDAAAAAAAAAAMHAAEGRVFHQQSAAPEMVNQQHLTGDIPVPMMHQIQLEGQPQPRPHYVQPRSVRSVDEVFHRRDKRVRRCACDCAC